MVPAAVFAPGYASDAVCGGSPLDRSCCVGLADEFQREGWLLLKSVLAPREVESLKAAMICKWEDPRIVHDAEDDHIRGVGLMRMFEYNQAFRDLIVREPVIGLVEEILGDDCHIIAQNALR